MGGFSLLRQLVTRKVPIFGALGRVVSGYYLVTRGGFLYHLANFFAAVLRSRRLLSVGHKKLMGDD